MREEYPEVVPILTADDIVRGYRNPGQETHCLLGWNDATFTGTAHWYVEQELRKEVKDTPNGNWRGDVAAFNDDYAVSKAKVAQLWNRVMRRLGYKVPCDRKS